MTSQPYKNHSFDVCFDDDLISKYNRQGPRYTSYPTALEFVPIADKTEAQILSQKDPSIPLSLYIHIPFCRHLCYYCGCNKIITKKNSSAGDYLEYLFKEILHKKSHLQGTPIVKQIHLGGGTPTFLSDDELVRLWRFLQAEFVLDDEGDFSVEIDPRELGDRTLSVLRELGVNRLSFGVQDLDDKVQIAVNRVQPMALIQKVMMEARALEFLSVNVDLIYGLPHQSVSGMADTVDKIIALSPDRVSLFNYAHLPDRFVAQKRIRTEDLPSSGDKLLMFKNAISQMTKAGYQYIGIDHFAKPSDELAIAQRQGKLHRNFQGYTILGECDLMAFGVSSISQIGRHIIQNHTDLKVYQTMINDDKLPAVKHLVASDEDLLRRDVIMNLLCHDRLRFDDVDKKFLIDSRTHFKKELAELNMMVQDELIKIDEMGIEVLPKGRILGRNIAMVFDEYLANKHTNRFSKVI